MSFGAALLRWLKLRPAGDGATALFGVGLGLGVLATLVLILGTLGFLEKVSWVVALMALLFLGMRDLGVLLRAAIGALRRARRASGFRVALWAVLGLFLLLNLTLRVRAAVAVRLPSNIISPRRRRTRTPATCSSCATTRTRTSRRTRRCCTCSR